MDALRHFPQELEDIMDLMTEKGLRVRTPLEEIQVLLEEWHAAKSGSQSVSLRHIWTKHQYRLYQCLW